MILVFAYLIGSIPTAYWIGKYFFNIDIRKLGSNNSGTTNALRIMGLESAIIVFIVDVLKGFIATHICISTSLILTSVFILIGHIFPIWSVFHGGKGVATLFGIVLAIAPILVIPLICIFLMTLISTKYVSLSNILASMSLPILVSIFNLTELLYFSILMPVIILLTHKNNIKRLINCNENTIY